MATRERQTRPTLQYCWKKDPAIAWNDSGFPGCTNSQAATAPPRSPASKLEITLDDEDDLMRGGLRAGARGYLLKDTDRKTLFNTIRAAVRGETLLRPEVLTRLLAQTESKPRSTPGAYNLELTSREREILAGVAHGQRSKEIALHLGITERTVKAHLASIYSKLGVDSRAGAIAVAAQRGWLPKV